MIKASELFFWATLNASRVDLRSIYSQQQCHSQHTDKYTDALIQLELHFHRQNSEDLGKFTIKGLNLHCPKLQLTNHKVHFTTTFKCQRVDIIGENVTLNPCRGCSSGGRLVAPVTRRWARSPAYYMEFEVSLSKTLKPEIAHALMLEWLLLNPPSPSVRECECKVVQRALSGRIYQYMFV